jgi:Holliday junction resolvase RusA-like endonuclease
MPRPLRLRFGLPRYKHPRNNWRRAINAEARRQLGTTRIGYLPTDRLDADVVLYLDGTHLEMIDLDNRLKDVLDALQGRAGGPKNIHTLPAIIPNDSQIFRASVEKRMTPKQNRRRGGWVTIRRYR